MAQRGPRVQNETDIVERVREAHARGTPLELRGGGTKAFYGRLEGRGEVLELAGQAGVVFYEPTELVLCARGGTPLAELEALLAAERQMLAFDPPCYGAAATLGGAVAAGLSGPRRPYAGAVRDFVLGVRVLSGEGRVLRFGGRVMKNVAGFDLSRLMAGALGTLGVLLEVTVKVLPSPPRELTLARPASAEQARELVEGWAARGVPLSASCHHEGVLRWRLSGSEQAVAAGRARTGGDGEGEGGQAFWTALRDHRLAFFDDPRPLWRLSLPAACPTLRLEGEGLEEWGGTLRWLKSDSPAHTLRAAVRAAGGHATLFRGGDRRGEVFEPLPAGLGAVHARLKRLFDPSGILNPGRLYADL